jgi:hypothetical protein
MQTIEILKDYTGLTKTDIKEMAALAIESVLENGNPLEVAESLSAMEDFIKQVKSEKRFTDYVREETIKYGKSFVSPSGAKIEIAETGSKYDFSNCNDLELIKLETILEDLTDRIKKRKDFLKTVSTSGIDIRHNDELITIYPPSKSSTSSYKITLAK